MPVAARRAIAGSPETGTARTGAIIRSPIPMPEKIVLAYSGGLDTSVAVHWLRAERGYDVVTLTVDVGNEPDLEAIVAKAQRIGAVATRTIDARELFVRYFVFPALQAGAVYQNQYPLATALARPLIAKLLVDIAREEGAVAVAHGCTGKGNDQVRFDVGVASLAPDLRIVAPAREWGMTRQQEEDYARRHGVPLPQGGSPFSIDQNLWGRSIEAGDLEDPWVEPPEAAFAWTKPVDATPPQPRDVEIEFERGVPVALDDQRLEGVDLIATLTRVAGEHGIGRIDHVEDRVVGIKSREVYEAPAAVVLLAAHAAVEAMVLSREQLALKQRLAQEYAELIYSGRWFSAHHQDIAAYVQSTQRFVSGLVRVRLHRGSFRVVGRRSPHSLYQPALATYGQGDTFDAGAAVGFIQIWGLPLRTQARQQLIGYTEEPLAIATPQVDEPPKLDAPLQGKAGVQA